MTLTLTLTICPYVPVRVTRCALVAHRYILMRLLATKPHTATGLTFIALSVSLWADLANHVFDGVRLVGFKS